jgi:PAS domain S-box-containing protein
MAILPEDTDLDVLIIEDNRDDIELLVYQLKKTFKSVRYTHIQNLREYREALPEFAESQSPPGQYKVILSDWAVPEYDCLAALELLHNIKQVIPFIVVSGAIGEPTAVALIKAGAYDFVFKEQSSLLTHVIPKALEWAEQRKTEEKQRLQIELQNKAFQSSPNAIAILNVQGAFEWVNQAYETLTGWTLQELEGRYLWGFCSEVPPEDCRQVFQELKYKDIHRWEGAATRKDGSRYQEFRQMAKLSDANNVVQQYLLIRQDITSLRHYHLRLEIDAELPLILANCQTEVSIYEESASYFKRVFEVQHAGFSRIDRQEKKASRWIGDDMASSSAAAHMQYPVLVDGKPKAICAVDWNATPIEGTDTLISYALEKLEQPLSRFIAQRKAKEWLQRLSLLDIFREYFGSGRNFNAAVLKILRIIRETLHADSISLFIQNADGTLTSKDYDGFLSDIMSNETIQPGEKNVGLAAEKRRIIAAADLAIHRDGYTPRFRALIEREKFVTQYCIPVILANEVRAVLELFFRAPFKPDETWLAFSQIAAYQTGLALQMQSIIEELAQTYGDLESANESILEGLSSALEFRDKETEGHTLRVTALFMSFASKFIQDENELKKLRVGSLLHDIGKIGISDTILNKPGPLTPEEQAEMKKHPLISREILSRIPSLHECIDIPLYHHEKYDGTGYPFGLKGEAIPLSARMFAIVDVYEALTSDRPYRKGWPKEKTLGYIRDNAGTHFDPELARRFIEMHTN